MNPANINQLFPLDQQRSYVSQLTGKHGLTRRRAEYFVRLWAYLLLKEQQETGKRVVQPLTELHPVQGEIPCTHREAAELFYAQKERGSDRAAGMMIDQLATLGLIKKKFDGSTICIQIRPLLELTNPHKQLEAAQLKTDAFNPRNDAVPAANLLIRNYSWLTPEFSATQKIARSLRDWAKQYLRGMRVLRDCNTENVVGFYMLYPTATESEVNFCLPPSKSLYLSTNQETDPIKLANVGDRDCTCVFLRAWTIDAPYMKLTYIGQFVEDLQQTLAQMQTDFPNLCDLYGMVLHPEAHDKVRLALGFQKTIADPHMPVDWIYQSVDRFLALNVRQALAKLTLNLPRGEF